MGDEGARAERWHRFDEDGVVPGGYARASAATSEGWAAEVRSDGEHTYGRLRHSGLGAEGVFLRVEGRWGSVELRAGPLVMVGVSCRPSEAAGRVLSGLAATAVAAARARA